METIVDVVDGCPAAELRRIARWIENERELDRRDEARLMVLRKDII